MIFLLINSRGGARSWPLLTGTPDDEGHESDDDMTNDDGHESDDDRVHCFSSGRPRLSVRGLCSNV